MEWEMALILQKCNNGFLSAQAPFITYEINSILCGAEVEIKVQEMHALWQFTNFWKQKLGCLFSTGDN